MRKLSRMEANKEVRRVLTRHYVDLSYCQYSVAGFEIRLTGWLAKIDQTDFSTPNVETMIQEFQRKLPGYHVAGELENWHFTTDHISYIGTKEENPNGAEFEGLLSNNETDYESDAS